MSKNSIMKKLIIRVIILLIIACSFIPFIVAKFASKRTEELKDKCTVPVTARIVDIKSKTEYTTDEDGNVDGSYEVYTPVYGFVLENDNELQADGRYWKKSPAYNIGDKADILVDPDDPTNIHDPRNTISKDDIKLAEYISLLFPFFTILFVVGIKLVLKSRKKQQNNQG